MYSAACSDCELSLHVHYIKMYEELKIRTILNSLGIWKISHFRSWISSPDVYSAGSTNLWQAGHIHKILVDVLHLQIQLR
jgi:hypothetical protein